MTIVTIIILATGVIFIASALDGTPIILTFQKIISGQPIDWTGSAGSLTMSPTGAITVNAISTTGRQGITSSGYGPTRSGSSGPFQIPPTSIPSQGSSSGTGGTSSPVWTRFAVTQQHGVNGETGIDIGTPFHTPLSALAPGQVVGASYGPWGGSVMVAVRNGASTLYYNYLHLDQIMVQLGQQISSGQLLGLSGGQLSGGSHPASSAYSSGPHTEFGVYTTPYISAQNALDPNAFYPFGG